MAKISQQLGLWETKVGCLVIPSSQVNPIFWFLHSFMHYSAFKMTDIIWINSRRETSTLQVHNPGKKQFLSSKASLRPPLSGPFEYLQLDFIQLPLNVGYQYVLVIAPVFWWVEAFLCCKANAPHWQGKKEYISQLGYTFYNILSVIKAPISLDKLYKPSWKVRKLLGIFTINKARSKELMRSLNLKFPNLKLLNFPDLRYCLWSCGLFIVPHLENKFIPHEIVTGRPMPIGIQPCVQLVWPCLMLVWPTTISL